MFLPIVLQISIHIIHLNMGKHDHDPLQLLRNAYNQKSTKQIPIRQKGNDLIFDKDIKLSLETETAWKSTKTDKQYNLGSLWLCLEHQLNKLPSISDYYRKVSQLKMDQVGVVDAEDIKKYFTGEISQTDCINQELKIVLSHKSRARDKPSVGFENIDEKGQKKVKLDNKFDEETTHLIKCIEYLNQYEKPMSSKSRCLKFPHKKFTNILTHLIQNQNNNQQRPTQQNQGKMRIAAIYEKKRLPIIIVPQKTIPGNVSIENIQKFLIRGEYDQYAKLSNPDISKIELQKRLRGKDIIFEINSRPQLLSEKDWQFVVAVFVLGRDNEFETWTMKNHKKVFDRALGYMIKFPKTQSGAASSWKCTIKNLDPISRIGDLQIVRTIWQDIENLLFTRT